MRGIYVFEMKSGKRILLAVAVLVAWILPAAEKNIVFVIADDLSPTIGCYGDMTAVTPNIDRLAADGTRFRYAFATTASCSASRSVILSGLHNHRNGHYGHLHSFHKFSSFPWVKTLPVLLAKAGYRTARVGKHHNGPEDIYFFETKIKANSRSTVEMANNCEAFIKADDKKPFFLYYATSDPHRGGGDANELPHKPNRFGNKPNKGAYPGVKEVFYDPAKVTVPPFLPDTPETRAELAQYYQSTSRVDQGLGRLMEILKKNGKWENTIIIFTSDHGDYLGDHGLGEKYLFHDASVKIPLIIAAPGVENDTTRGMKRDELVEAVDILPTLIQLTSADTCHERLEGHSLLPLLELESTAVNWREFAVSELDYSDQGVRNRLGLDADMCRAIMIKSHRWKYIHYWNLRPQLFDLHEDPNEFVDLGSMSEYKSICHMMDERLVSWQNSLKRRVGIAYDCVLEQGPDRDEKNGFIIGRW